MPEDVRAEMVAKVCQVVATPGQSLAAGDEIVLLESMKMEIPVLAPAPGTVETVSVCAGDVVRTGDLIARLAT